LKQRAPGWTVLSPDFTLMEFDDFLADRKAQAGTAGAGSGLAALHELIKNDLQLTRWNADPLVLDGAKQCGSPCAVSASAIAIVMVPPTGEYLIAFEYRFMKTCRICCRSQDA
jgi:hypothetical protein